MPKYSTIPCGWCGKDVHRERPGQKYCSRACRLSGLHSKPVTYDVPNQKTEHTCRKCGGTFLAYVSQERTYCSRKCKNLADQNKKNYVCAWCGGAFQKPASVHAPRCCSRACDLAFRLEPAGREARFWSHVDKSLEHGCWPWTLALMKTGYGSFGKPGKLAHRLAWEFSRKQTIPKGMVVMHLCDNRACCRPEHLMLGTHRSNIEDMVGKGRNRNHLSEKEPLPPTDYFQMSLMV